MRDLRRVGVKLKHVLVPRGGSDETIRALKDWDLCEYRPVRDGHRGAAAALSRAFNVRQHSTRTRSCLSYTAPTG
jgi:hypothetical protein